MSGSPQVFCRTGSPCGSSENLRAVLSYPAVSAQSNPYLFLRIYLGSTADQISERIMLPRRSSVDTSPRGREQPEQTPRIRQQIFRPVHARQRFETGVVERVRRGQIDFVLRTARIDGGGDVLHYSLTEGGGDLNSAAINLPRWCVNALLILRGVAKFPDVAHVGLAHEPLGRRSGRSVEGEVPEDKILWEIISEFVHDHGYS